MTQTAKRAQKNLECDRIIGSLTSASIEVNFDSLKTDKALSCGVQSPSRFRGHARWIDGKKMEFPVLKMNLRK